MITGVCICLPGYKQAADDKIKCLNIGKNPKSVIKVYKNNIYYIYIYITGSCEYTHCFYVNLQLRRNAIATSIVKTFHLAFRQLKLTEVGPMSF